MKNQTLSNTRNAIRNVLTPAAFACLLMAASISASAKTHEKKSEKASPTPVEVKYLGTLNNAPIFQMNIDNSSEDELYVTLKDESGSTLYGEKVKGKFFSKKFQFTSLDDSALKVTMSVSSKHYRKPQVFEIANVSKVVEDVVINELH